jgi:hypothetical protein
MIAQVLNLSIEETNFSRLVNFKLTPLKVLCHNQRIIIQATGSIVCPRGSAILTKGGGGVHYE